MAQSLTLTGIARAEYVGTIAMYQHTQSALQTQMVDDLENVFFNTTEFANTVLYTHKGSGITKTYREIFDKPSQEIKPGSNSLIIGMKPQIMLSTAHMIHEPSSRDTVLVNGIAYNVDSFEDDGVGVVTIYLTRKGQSRN